MSLDPTSTYDLATPIGQVRLLLMDVDVDSSPPDAATARSDWSVIFVDAEITAQLANYTFNAIPYAAADLLDAMANNAAAIAKLQKIGDYEQDNRGVSRELSQRAEKIRHRADSIPFEMLSDYMWTDANWGRMLIQPQAGQ